MGRVCDLGRGTYLCARSYLFDSPWPTTGIQSPRHHGDTSPAGHDSTPTTTPPARAVSSAYPQHHDYSHGHGHGPCHRQSHSSSGSSSSSSSIGSKSVSGRCRISYAMMNMLCMRHCCACDVLWQVYWPRAVWVTTGLSPAAVAEAASAAKALAEDVACLMP